MPELSCKFLWGFFVELTLSVWTNLLVTEKVLSEQTPSAAFLTRNSAVLNNPKKGSALLLLWVEVVQAKVLTRCSEDYRRVSGQRPSRWVVVLIEAQRHHGKRLKLKVGAQTAQKGDTFILIGLCFFFGSIFGFQRRKRDCCRIILGWVRK